MHVGVRVYIYTHMINRGEHGNRKEKRETERERAEKYLIGSFIVSPRYE